MKIIKKFRKSEKGSITVMVLAAMLFLIGVITVSYFAMSNKSIEQNKKVSQIAKQYRASDEDMEKEYQKAINNLKVEDYVKVGDYVDYNPTIASKDGTKVEESKLSYTSPIGTATEHGNGNSEQTFKATEDTKWRVLNVEKDGSIELISENAIKTDLKTNFIIEFTIGYLYAEQELNEACKIFGYGYGADTTKGGSYTVGGPLDTPVTGKIEETGARSMTIEDINKIIGVYEENNKIKDSDGKVIEDTYGNTNNPTVGVYYPTIDTEKGNTNGLSNKTEAKNLKATYYSYNFSKLGIDIVNGNNWLASRCISAGSDRVTCGVRCIEGSLISKKDVFYGSSDSFGNSTHLDNVGIRPIITLKSNIIDINTDYNKEKKWKLK